MMNILRDIHETLKPYYVTISLILSWIGFLIIWYRRRQAWQNKEFLGQFNFSLNLFGETLMMRTLLERATTSVLMNAHGVGLLVSAAKRTSAEQPFIHLADKADRDYLHRAIKNALSEICPQTFIAAALGTPVHRGTFVFALTCERYAEIRTIKLRVIVIEERTLVEWCAPGGKAEALPMTDYYRTRLRTLQAMYEMHRKSAAEGMVDLGEVELGVPA